MAAESKAHSGVFGHHCAVNKPRCGVGCLRTTGDESKQPARAPSGCQAKRPGRQLFLREKRQHHGVEPTSPGLFREHRRLSTRQARWVLFGGFARKEPPLFGARGHLHCPVNTASLVLGQIEKKPKGASGMRGWQHHRLATDSLAAQCPEVEGLEEAELQAMATWWQARTKPRTTA